MSCALGALLTCALLQASPASASVSVGDVQVGESGSATFTVTHSGGILTGPTSVTFRTAHGSAGASDYTARSGTLSFGSLPFGGSESQQVAVAITPDALDEPSETFAFVVSGGDVAGGSAAATATIADDDPAPSVSVLDSPSVQEGAAGAQATFTVALSAPSGRPVSVAYTTVDGSATAGQDYAARSGTIVLPAGSTHAEIHVGVLDDAIDEPAEAFALQLGALDAARAGRSTASATIVDDDEPPAPPASAAGSAPTTTTGSGQATGTPSRPQTGSSAPSTGSAATRQELGLSSPRLRRPATVLVTISCPQTAGRCRGRVTIFSIANRRSRVKALRKERKLGRVTFSLAGGRSQTLSLTLKRTDLGLLRRTGRMKVRAYAITQDSAGRTGVRSAGGTLIARTAHSSSGD